MNNEILINVIGYAAATIGSIMFMPQAYEVWKTKQTKGVSLISFALLAAVSFLWGTYGVLIQATPVILVNVIIGILSIYIVLMKLKYR